MTLYISFSPYEKVIVGALYITSLSIMWEEKAQLVWKKKKKKEVVVMP